MASSLSTEHINIPVYSKEALLALLLKKVLIRQADEPIFDSNGGRSAWLFDFRRVLLQGDVLESLAVLFWEKIESAYQFQVGGMESASIPLITAVVLEGKKRGLPVNGFYIRKSRKKEGLLKQVEGALTNEPIVLVDDLINSGNTFNKQVVLLEELGQRVSTIVAVVRFREQTHYRFLEEHGITIHHLFTLEDFGVFLKLHAPVHYNQFTVKWRLDGTEPDLHRVTHKPKAVYDETAIYFPTDDGYVYALDQKTGEKKWHFRVGLVKKSAHRISDLSLAAQTIYFSTYGGKIFALDAATGIMKWVFADADRIDGAPCISSRRQRVYAVVNRGWFLKKNFLVALDMRQGDEIWATPLPEYSLVKPLLNVSEDRLVLGCENGAMLYIDALNGRIAWTQILDGAISGVAITPGPANTSSVYATTTKGTVSKLDTHSGAIEKTITLDGSIRTTPLVLETGLVVTNLDKCIYSLDLKTLAILWSCETAGRIFADPTYINGHLYVGSNDARLYEIHPQRGAVTGITQVTERITTPLLFCHTTNYYFLTTYANELYCLSKKENPD